MFPSPHSASLPSFLACAILAAHGGQVVCDEALATRVLHGWQQEALLAQRQGQDGRWDDEIRPRSVNKEAAVAGDDDDVVISRRLGHFRWELEWCRAIWLGAGSRRHR